MISSRPTPGLTCLLLIILLGCYTSHRSSFVSMDNKEREDFLANVEAEEDWLDQVSRRLSLPNSASSSARNIPARKETKTCKPPASCGPVTRASRKRRFSKDLTGSPDMSDNGQPNPPGKRPSMDDGAVLGKLEQMIAGVRSDIAKSEANTVARIDDLSSGLTTRLTSAELAISTLGGDIARVQNDIAAFKQKSDVQARSLSTVVEEIVTRKLASRPPPSRPAKASATFGGASSVEQKYLEARKSLRMWPVPGPDLQKSVIDFVTDKLRLPSTVVPDGSFQVKPITSSRIVAAVDLVVVVLDSIRTWDK